MWWYLIIKLYSSAMVVVPDHYNSLAECKVAAEAIRTDNPDNSAGVYGMCVQSRPF